MELDLDKVKAETAANLKRNKGIILGLFVCGLLGLYIIMSQAPNLTQYEVGVLISLPKTPGELMILSSVVSAYVQKSYWYCLLLYCYVYVFILSFNLPGSPLLNLLGGALLGFHVSLLLFAICGCVGSTLCFILIETFGKGLAIRWFPEKILDLHNRIRSNRDRMFFYLLSLRIMPFVPKFFISLACPVIGVSIVHFVATAVLGLTPAALLHINLGTELSNLEDLQLTLNMVLILVSLAFLALVPTLFSNKIKNS